MEIISYLVMFLRGVTGRAATKHRMGMDGSGPGKARVGGPRSSPTQEVRQRPGQRSPKHRQAQAWYPLLPAGFGLNPAKALVESDEASLPIEQSHGI